MGRNHGQMPQGADADRSTGKAMNGSVVAMASSLLFSRFTQTQIAIMPCFHRSSVRFCWLLCVPEPCQGLAWFNLIGCSFDCSHALAVRYFSRRTAGPQTQSNRQSHSQPCALLLPLVCRLPSRRRLGSEETMRRGTSSSAALLLMLFACPGPRTSPGDCWHMLGRLYS